MASRKPTMILLSKTDMSAEAVEVLSDADAWKLIYGIRSIKSKDKRLQICFTGFGVAKKEELVSVASENGFHVVCSVTKSLDYLCGGANAGPKKIEKAEAQGVQFLTVSQLLRLIETGEISEAP